MSMLQLLFNRLEQDNARMQEIKASPAKSNMYQALKTGNAAQGQQLAENYCKSCGVSIDEMLMRANTFFGIK